MPAFWVGIDSGKRAHHCVVIDQTGTVLLSKRVENDETVLLDLIATIAEIAAGGEVCWATDLNTGGAALLIELLAAHGQQLLYIPGNRTPKWLQHPIQSTSTEALAFSEASTRP